MDLIQEQNEIEIGMSNRGIDRYERAARDAANNGEATRTKSVQVVMDTAIDLVADALDNFREGASSGKAGRRHSAIKQMDGLPSKEISYLALRIILDGIGKSLPVTPIACTIGRAIEMEARMHQLAITQEAYVKVLMKDLDSRTGHARHRRAVLSRVMREKGDKWDNWGEQDHVRVGVKMVELVIQSTGLLSVAHSRMGKKTIAVLVPTPRFTDWLHSLDAKFGLYSPDYMPCVIPPKDWTGLNEGGYHTDALAFPPSLVKTSNREHRKALEKADLTRVLSAVNAIQRTGWAVNKRVLDVALDLITSGRPVAGLPDLDNTPLPSRPLDIDTNEEAKTAWKREASKVYDHNRRMTGRRVQALKCVRTAEEFARYDAIYFPHQLDFRGRVYPIPQVLNPQGDDLAKGLLMFSEGDRLDTLAAIQWFKVHGANCFGVDKVDMDERMQWVEDNAVHIIRSAEDPIGYQWWADADSPFCFLAWAFEFNDWLQSDVGNGTFVSRIAVAMDGSCNGLQHYSAMLRDARGGAATNLVPSVKPQDIYGEVAKVVNASLYRIANTVQEVNPGLSGEDKEKAIKDAAYAAAWGAFGIDRKITKRPVMVLPYGGTQRSCSEYVHEAVSDRPDVPFPGDLKASAWLGNVVWSSIGEVVVAAKLAMGWLRAVASVASKENRPLQWTAPSGFPVFQAYPEMRKEQIKTFLLGNRFDPALQVLVPGQIDKRRQVNGVAPNFVHSLDAAAMIGTVNLATDRGLSKFAMIHDSYGTTAGKAAALAEALRDAFVDMYEQNDVLEQFRQSALPTDLRSEIPDQPSGRGSLPTQAL